MTDCLTDIMSRLVLLDEEYWSDGRVGYAIEELVKARLMLCGPATGSLFHDVAFEGSWQHRLNRPARYLLSVPYLRAQDLENGRCYAAEVALTSTVVSRIPQRCHAYDYQLYRYPIASASRDVI